jgi:hypothetical protein
MFKANTPEQHSSKHQSPQQARMDHSTRSSMKPCPSAVAVGLIGWILLGFGPSVIAAESERTTALVTIAQANAQCLIQTGTMGAEKALTLANRFLDAKQVSQKQRRTVNNSPGFEDLMKRYINQQGGCEAIVKDFR